jgi:hypothetical protein
MVNEFVLMREGFISGELYIGRQMAGKDGKLRYVDGKTAKGNPVRFGIQIRPLYMYQEGKKEPHYRIVAFVSPDPKAMADNMEVTEKESKIVSENARLRLLDQSTDLAARKFSGGFYFVKKHVFGGYDEKVSGPLSLLLMVALCGSLVFTAFAIYSLWTRKPPTIQHIEIPVSPAPDR